MTVKTDKPVSYETLVKKTKGLRLPSRSKLTRLVPTDEEQLQMFILRQKKVPEILAQWGITFGKTQYLWPDGKYRAEQYTGSEPLPSRLNCE